ncbi:MAG: helix-turn-helix domain-containing protein [Candidatus Izemoplasmatales bacterium]|nr:helix-turn-helix domain-containing protein [Candidatus Izemoplasmatales bacterium]
MGRPKGGTNRYWSKEAKYEHEQLLMSGEISANEPGRLNIISNGTISTWIKRFQESGIETIENK